MPTTYDVKEIKRTGGIDDTGARTYVRTFRVITSNRADGPAIIAAQVPYILYEPYNLGPGNDRDLAAILRSVDTQPENDEGFWLVTLTYTSKQSQADRGTVQPNQPGVAPSNTGGGNAGAGNNATPANERPWVIKWGAIQTESFLTHDVSEEEKPFVNSAGQPFDPPPSIPETHQTLSITAFSSSINAAKPRIFFNKVNQFTFLGAWPPGWGRVTRYEQTSMYENGAFFWQTDVTIEFKEDGWNPVKVLDAGTLYRKTNLLPLQPIVVNGQPVTSPVPLNGFGEPLRGGEALVYLEFQGYYEADFENLFGP